MVINSYFVLIFTSLTLIESRPPGKPRRLILEPLSREIIVSWIPANETILTRGYRLGYGTVIPEEKWMDVEPDKRFASLLKLSKYIYRLLIKCTILWYCTIPSDG